MDDKILKYHLKPMTTGDLRWGLATGGRIVELEAKDFTSRLQWGKQHRS